jgi:hypothetical protein
MIRLAIAALLGALVGAIVAAGVSLLAFTYPVQTEVSNLPLDDSGNLKVTGVIETTIGVGTAGQPQASIDELVEWGEAPTLECVCSETR